MPNKLELQNLKKRKEQLEKAVEFTKQKKEQIIRIVQNLIFQLNSKQITRNEYEEKLSQALKNRGAEQWLKYYDDYLNYYNSQIEFCNNLIKQEETKRIKTLPILKFLILIVSISLIISLIFILKPVFIEKTEVFLKPEAPEKPRIILEQAKILEETFNQLSAIAEKPVKWQLEFNLDTPSNFNTKLPPNSKLISVKNEQNQEIEAKVNEELIGKEINVKVKEKLKKFQIIYETPAPEIKEEIIGENKKLTITAPIDYSNILSFAELQKELSKEELGKLKLYQIKDGQRKSVKFTAYDTNENNLFDFIEFIAPGTGEYELVIEISKAEHLDKNKTFISDIYEQVKELDGNWSEAIKENEYIRVTFQQKLDNSRDITIYPRIVSGNPRIEVYEINNTKKIAEFTSLINNTYNKVYLTSLPEEYSQDIFDLRIINGSIEIEHIIDPAAETVFVSNNEAHDISFAILNDSTGMFVMAWCDDTTDSAYYRVLYTNGSAYAATQTIDTSAGDSCRISVAALNSTVFTISYIDWVSGSSDWKIIGYGTNGNTLFGPITIDTDINSYVDIDTCALNSTNYISVIIDDNDNDATFVIYSLGRQVRGQTDLDTGANPDAGILDQDAVGCSALSQNSWFFTYYDDNPDQIAYAMYNEAGIITKPLAAVSASSIDGATSVSALANENFVIAFCDSTDNDVSFIVYNSLGTAITSKTDVDLSISSCSGASGTHIDVHALNTSDGQFAIIYDDTEVDKIYLAVYNSSGSPILSPIEIEATSDTAEKSVAVTGYDKITGMSLCKYTDKPVFVVGYNDATNAVWRTYYSNGSVWDGNCTTTKKNQPPQIIYIEPIQDQAPTENAVKTVTFNVRVSDPDGVIDINDNSITAEFSKIGETTKTNNCQWQSDIDVNTASYLCSVEMQYYDGAGTWNIKINATDYANNLIENTSKTFIYQELKAIVISPLSLTWPQITPGAINQLSGTSTIITNTGNHEGGIIIQAKNLYGGTRTTEYIPANAFTAGTLTGAENPECNAPTSATQLEDSNNVLIINSMLNKGPAAQEEIFYCIPQVPLMSSQTYSTQQAGSWTITVLVAAIIVKKKKKKKPTKKLKNIKDSNLIRALKLLSVELKQEFTEEKEEIIKILIKEIKKKYKLNNKEIIQLTETKKEAIPLSIFKYKSGALESLCRYMKENLNMKYREIAKLLQRNERTIWTAYNKSKKKQKEPLIIKEKDIFLPVSVFNEKLTILESIILFLKSKQMKYVEIANLLNRDQRNIWTIYSKAIKK